MASELSCSGDAGEQALRRIGQQLRERRLARGEDLRAIAAYLRIKPDFLEALEGGDLAALPGRPYASGFLRSYAEHLALDGNSLAARLTPCLHGPAPSPRVAMVRHCPSHVQTCLVALAALLIAGTIWIGNQTASPPLAGSAAILAQAPAPANLPPVQWPDAGQAVASESAERPPLAMLVSAESEVGQVRSGHPAAEAVPMLPAPSSSAP